MHNIYLKKISRTANVGLYGSLAVSIVTLALYYLWNKRFYINEQGFRFMLVAGCILAILAICTILFTVRKSTPKLRQMDDLNEKLGKYSDQVSNIYLTTLGIVVVECVLITLSHNSILFMLLMLLVLTLFMLYPNHLKVKTDLGLSDEQMSELFPDLYKTEKQDE